MRRLEIMASTQKTLLDQKFQLEGDINVSKKILAEKTILLDNMTHDKELLIAECVI
jgi:hypothetical protein